MKLSRERRLQETATPEDLWDWRIDRSIVLSEIQETFSVAQLKEAMPFGAGTLPEAGRGEGKDGSYIFAELDGRGRSPTFLDVVGRSAAPSAVWGLYVSDGAALRGAASTMDEAAASQQTLDPALWTKRQRS